MKTTATIDHFSAAAGSYDGKNEALAPIATNMHFLIRLILQRGPVKARVLCVGVGTGAEILSLAQAFPQWTFVGVDPAVGMLEVCKEKLDKTGVLDRCELAHGYVQDLPQGEGFDVVLSILVAHFIKYEERLSFYREMWTRLRNNGFFISTEISYDLDSAMFPLMIKNWKAVQSLMGANAESLTELSLTLREKLAVISPAETEKLLKHCGIDRPVQFFQAFMINGWYGIKSSEYRELGS